jgi:hypothetical protein
LATLDLQASISDSLSDVRSVNYVVHMPSGMHVLAVIKTGSLMGLKETVTDYSDAAPNTFSTYITVHTGTSGVHTVGYSTLISLLNIALGSSTVYGVSGQAMYTHFQTLL